ncbi:MAG: hypothetical protein KJZ65_15450 [Phycisphaerales bacterium]|nr:hypothetical protein [Phycisphaerales bacterium]
MPGLVIPNLTTSPRPLTADEAAMCDRVAGRLHADLSRLVSQLPLPAQSGSGMARHLDVVRNTTQRVVHALRDPAPSLQTLVKLPGVKGLEQLLEAMGRAGLDTGDIELAQVGVRQFDQLIETLAGSHAKLAGRIASAGGGEVVTSLATTEARQLLFESAVGVTGRRAEVSISLYAFRRSTTNPDQIQRAIASGVLQTTVMPGGMPVVIRVGDTLEWDDPEKRSVRLLDDSTPHGRTPEALLRAFTTHPLPTVSSQGTADNMVQVIDPAGLDGPQTLDVITAARSDHPYLDPRTQRLNLDEVWSLVNCPSRRLLFDVYLHRDIERLVRPRVEALMWYPNLSSPGGQKWLTRFPAQPRLELLGEGIGNARAASHARHPELTRTLFDRVGWNPSEFVGFRCEVEYPIWRAGYCMTFDPVSGEAGNRLE